MQARPGTPAASRPGMMPSLSGVLGLPPGMPSPIYDVAALRYLLLGLVGVWAWAFARRRVSLAALTALACCLLSTGFWTLALKRPWGVLVDVDATRAAAELSVAAEAGASVSFVVGESPATSIRRFLLSRGAPLVALQLLPTLLPALVLPALGLAVFAAWGRRADSLLAASLVLVASTSELGSARGWGLLGGIWSHPAAAVALPLATCAALLAARVRRVGVLAGVAPLLILFATPPRTPLSGGAVALAMTVDQGLFLPLGLFGLWRDRDPGSLALVLGGASVCVAGVIGAPVDAWAGLALLRIGLILGAAPVVCDLAERCLDALRPPARVDRVAASRRDLGAALVLLIAAPASILVWWDPPATDPVYAASLAPPSVALEGSMRWIRDHTPADAVVLTSPAYASQVAVRAGRRVLRAPEMPASPDASRRVRAERLLLARRPLPEWVRRYGVGWVLVAPGDFRARGVDVPEDLVGRRGLRLRYRDENRIHIFEVELYP